MKYTNGHIFAVKGSTVNISCTYTYPYGTVTDKFWFMKKRIRNFENLKSMPEYSGRVENICDDKINRCTLIIRNLTESDSTVYMFRFITDQHDGKYFGKIGVTLRVSGNILFCIFMTSVSDGWRASVSVYQELLFFFLRSSGDQINSVSELWQLFSDTSTNL